MTPIAPMTNRERGERPPLHFLPPCLISPFSVSSFLRMYPHA